MAKLAKMKKLELLGQGNYGEVFKAEDQDTHEIFAVKIFYMDQDDYAIPRYVDLLMSRFMNVTDWKNEAILKYYDYSKNGFDKEHRPALLTEYCVNGSLENCIPKMNDTKKIINMYGIANAMHQLHEKGILHYNLTSKNVLEDENFYPKLKDFQMSLYLHGLKEMAKLKEISIYTAPETLISNDYTKQSEVYAYGIILYEMIVEEKPFKDMTSYQILEKKIAGYIPPIPDSFSTSLRYLIESCLDKDPERRPSFYIIKNFIVSTMNE